MSPNPYEEVTLQEQMIYKFLFPATTRTQQRA